MSFIVVLPPFPLTLLFPQFLLVVAYLLYHDYVVILQLLDGGLLILFSFSSFFFILLSFYLYFSGACGGRRLGFDAIVELNCLSRHSKWNCVVALLWIIIGPNQEGRHLAILRNKLNDLNQLRIIMCRNHNRRSCQSLLLLPSLARSYHLPIRLL